MIVCHLVDLAEAAEQLEQPPNVGFVSADHAGDVADARRAKSLLVGNQRSDVPPQRFLGGGQPHFMARQANPGAVERDLLGPRQLLQCCGEGRRRQSRLDREPQPLQSDAGQIRIVGVKRREPVEDAALELRPALRRQRDVVSAPECGPARVVRQDARLRRR